MHTLRPTNLPDPRREQMQLEGRYYTLPVASRSPTGGLHIVTTTPISLSAVSPLNHVDENVNLHTLPAASAGNTTHR
jgi:hypothetical protein